VLSMMRNFVFFITRSVKFASLCRFYSVTHLCQSRGLSVFRIDGNILLLSTLVHGTSGLVRFGDLSFPLIAVFPIAAKTQRVLIKCRNRIYAFLPYSASIIFARVKLESAAVERSVNLPVFAERSDAAGNRAGKHATETGDRSFLRAYSTLAITCSLMIFSH